jgi:hypothetical protein
MMYYIVFHIKVNEAITFNMTCKCITAKTDDIIDHICNEIEDLDIDNPWMTYLNQIDDKYKTASIRWSLTKSDTRIWFARVLKNISKGDLIVWAHKESFCLNQRD